MTTYTYTGGSLSSDTVSANDDERLPPGSFSLRYGLPNLFNKSRKRDGKVAETPPGSGQKMTIHMASTNISIGEQSDLHAGRNLETSDPLMSTQNANPSRGRTVGSTIVHVLDYMRRCFCEETLLDKVPLELAGNIGAWKAWSAYRASKGVSLKEGAKDGHSKDHQEDWNWDGVWVNRVRKGIDQSLAQSTVYGSGDVEDLVSALTFVSYPK